MSPRSLDRGAVAIDSGRAHFYITDQSVSTRKPENTQWRDATPKLAATFLRHRSAAAVSACSKRCRRACAARAAVRGAVARSPPTAPAAAFEYAAEMRARTESRLGFRVAGKMTRRPAELGARVKAGQVLAQLDPQDLRLGKTLHMPPCAAQINSSWPRPTSSATGS